MIEVVDLRTADTARSQLEKKLEVVVNEALLDADRKIEQSFSNHIEIECMQAAVEKVCNELQYKGYTISDVVYPEGKETSTIVFTF